MLRAGRAGHAVVIRRHPASGPSGMPAVSVTGQVLLIGSGRLLWPPVRRGVFRLPSLREVPERVILDREILLREIVNRALLFRGPLPPAGAQRAHPVVRGVKAPLQLGVAQVSPAPRTTDQQQHEQRQTAKQADRRHGHASEHEQPPDRDVVLAEGFADKDRCDARSQ